LTSGLQTYSSLPAHYAPHNWTSLESYMLSQAINVHALAGTNRDKQWVNIVLKYLKLWSSGSIGESLTRQDDSAMYIANLVESLKLAVDELSERLWFFFALGRSVVLPGFLIQRTHILSIPLSPSKYSTQLRCLQRMRMAFSYVFRCSIRCLV